MKKSIVVICGSPRSESNSMQLCNRLLATAGENCEAEIFNAYSIKAEPCLACGYCETHKGCVMNDLDEFFAAYEKADYIVIATPIYNSGVPAPLKAIVDRAQRYYALRFSHGIKPTIAKPKRAALIVTAGCKGSGFETVKTMFEQQFTVLNTHLVSTVFVGSTDAKPLDSAAFETAAKAGNELFK